MDQQTARTLAQLNSEFYRTVANSFSATRQAPWHGWITLADILQEAAWPATSEVDYPSLTGALSDQTIVLDAACGNLRFESFLQNRFPRTCFEFHALDNCDSLLPQVDRRVASLVFHKCDLMAALLALREADLQKQISAKQVSQQQPCTRYTHDQVLSDNQHRGGEPSLEQAPEQELFCAIPLSGLVVSFGFMHHIPALENRIAFLRALIQAAEPGGYVAVSLWRFMEDARLARKVRSCWPAAQKALVHRGVDPSSLEEGDFLLGWQDQHDVWRYCHHFSDEEACMLVDAVANEGRLIANFTADGLGNKTNRYLVFKRESAGNLPLKSNAVLPLA